MTARLNLTMSQGTRDRIDALNQRTRAGSATVVIRRALDVYSAIADVVEGGGRIELRRPDGTVVELVVPELSR